MFEKYLKQKRYKAGCSLLHWCRGYWGTGDTGATAGTGDAGGARCTGVIRNTGGTGYLDGYHFYTMPLKNCFYNLKRKFSFHKNKMITFKEF